MCVILVISYSTFLFQIYFSFLFKIFIALSLLRGPGLLLSVPGKPYCDPSYVNNLMFQPFYLIPCRSSPNARIIDHLDSNLFNTALTTSAPGDKISSCLRLYFSDLLDSGFALTLSCTKMSTSEY